MVLAFSLLLAIVVVAASDGDSAPDRKRLAPQPPNAAQRTYALLTGIPQRETVLGYPKAPVTLQFFGDLQCFQSRQVMMGALPSLIRRWVRTGELQIRFRSVETDTLGAGGWVEFRNQQSGALAAGEQNKLWNFVSVFYREQGPEFTGYADKDFLSEIAMRSGVDMQRWEKDWSPEAWIPEIKADGALAKRKGLESTPSFLIGPTGGPARPLRHFGLEEARVFDEAVKGFL